MAAFLYNFSPYNAVTNKAMSNSQLSFFAFNVYESISLKHLNVQPRLNYNPHSTLNTQSLSILAGMYVLTASSLSLINSGIHSTVISNTSGTAGSITVDYWADVSSWYVTQNLTPGTWYIGLLPIFSTSNASITIVGMSLGGIGGTMAAGNAFPLEFMSGSQAATTLDLPSLIATNTLVVTGAGATNTPCIIISA